MKKGPFLPERGKGVLFLLAQEKNEKNARPFRSIGSVQKVCFYTLLPTRVCTGFAVQATAEHAARAPSAADRFCACGRGRVLRQSVPHGTRSPAAQIVRCGVLRGSFLHKRSSDALAASFSFFFFPQRKRTRASPFWKRKTLTKKRTHPRPFFLYFVPKRRSPASPSPGRM